MSKGRNKGEESILWTERISKKKKTGETLRFLLFFILSLSLFIGGSLFYVWSRIQVIQLGYEISSTLKEGKALTETNKRLRLEVAALKSYARIEKIAVEELKMLKPKPDQVIVIR
jgi:cell division protein FtsL